MKTNLVPNDSGAVPRSTGILCGLLLGVMVISGAAEIMPAPLAHPHVKDRILIQRKKQTSLTALDGLHLRNGSRIIRTFDPLSRLQSVAVPPGKTVSNLIASYRASGLVEFAEPDYIAHISSSPNDPKYLDGTLWGLNNTGQNGGTPDADIDAPEAWDVLNSASNIVVAVLDTGVRATHEDLAANMWINPQDGGHGFNALVPASSPNDDNGHGTLVSGILGGVGNNGKGMVGVAWRVQIMACKCLDSAGNGTGSDIIACIDYARTNGAKVINASFDTTGYSEAMSNAIASARAAGIIFVASAGNNTANLDLAPRYPSSYDIDNIVSVGYTTRSNTLGRFSNYGVTNVDLAAPGASIYSTFFPADNSYLGSPSLEGTSFAAPYVTGAFALMLAKFPGEDYQQLIRRVLQATDPLPALAGKCATGGLLNLRKALSPPITLAITQGANHQPTQVQVTGGPNRICVIEYSTNLVTWFPIYTNTTSTSGSFNFTENPSDASRFYRAVSTP
jgi:subtilisin family serine protease